MDLTPKAKIVTRGEAAETPPEVAVTPETPTPMLEVGTINGDGEDDQQIRGPPPLKCCYFLIPCGVCSVLWVFCLVIIVVITTIVGAVAAALTALADEKQEMIHRAAVFGVPVGLFLGVVVIILHLVYMHTCHWVFCTDHHPRQRGYGVVGTE